MPRSHRSPGTPHPIAIICVLALATLACNFPLLTSSMSVEEALQVQPQDERPRVLDEMGPPDAFTIAFRELEGQTVRWEEWSYHEVDGRFDFVDGELLWVIELEPVADGSLYAHFYDPLAFSAAMSLSDARALLGDQELVEVHLEEGDLPGGLILAGDQILLGFEHERLIYVQTFVLSPEGS